MQNENLVKSVLYPILALLPAAYSETTPVQEREQTDYYWIILPGMQAPTLRNSIVETNG